MAGAVRGQVAGHERSEAARAAGDEDRRLRVGRLGDAEHELAGVARLTQEAECLLAVAHVKGGDRQVLEHARCEEPQYL